MANPQLWRAESRDWSAPKSDSVGLAVLIPGRDLAVATPLLHAAGRTAQQHRWQVREVWWEGAPLPDDPSTDAWVRERVAEAVGDHAGRVLLVAKSLSTRAASYAAERGWDAVWLTPLLTVPHVAEAMARHPGRQLLVGGTADDIAWDRGVARGLVDAGCEVLEVPDADHALAVPGDAVRTAGVHLDVTRAVRAFLGGDPG